MGKDIRVNALKEKFQAYCHEENCSTTEVCPEECDCEKELDLDTAIAWTAALMIKGLIYLDPDNDSSMDTVFYGYFVVLRYHKKKYRKLYNLMMEACEMITWSDK